MVRVNLQPLHHVSQEQYLDQASQAGERRRRRKTQRGTRRSMPVRNVRISPAAGALNRGYTNARQGTAGQGKARHRGDVVALPCRAANIQPRGRDAAAEFFSPSPVLFCRSNERVRDGWENRERARRGEENQALESAPRLLGPCWVSCRPLLL